MATVQIRSHGNQYWDNVELENFSTEETLKALLEQFKAFAAGFTATTTDTKNRTEKSQSRVEKLLAGLGGAAIGAGSGSKLPPSVSESISPVLNIIKPFAGIIEDLEALTPEVLLAVVAFKLVTAAVSVFQAGLNLVSRTVTSIFSVAGNLINVFVGGRKTMADYFDAIAKGTASIPIIGTFTSLLASGMQILSKWNDTLFELNSMGAGFGNSIGYMVASAAATGQSLEQYSQVIKSNINNLAAFGSVIEGVRTYTAVANVSMNAYAGRLQELGISLDQYQSELPGVLALFGASMKSGGATTRDLAAAAIDLTDQFTAMSKITGKTREQQAADLARLTEDAAWKQKLSTMSNEDAEKYLGALNEIQSTAGDSFTELYKLSVLGMPPLTKELQILMATTPGLSEQFSKMTELVKTGNPKLASYGQQMDQIAGNIVEQGLASGQNLTTLISAASAGLSGVPEIEAKLQKQLLDRNAEYYHEGQFNKTRFLAMLEQAREEGRLQDQIHSSLSRFSTDVSRLQSDFFRMVIIPLLNRLGPIISTIADTFEKNSGAIQGIIDKIVDGINEFGGWLVNHRQEIQEDIQSFMGTIVTVFNVLVSITKFLIEHWDTIKTILITAGIAVVALAAIVGVAGLGLIIPLLVEGLGSLAAVVGAIVEALSGSSILGALGGLAGGGAAGTTATAGAEVAGGAAVAGGAEAAAGGAGVLGLGEGGAALGGLMAGEAMIPGVGWAALGATALVAGGIYAWQKYAESKEKDRKEAEKMHRETANKGLPDHGETLNNIHDTLQEQHDTLMQIAKNTGSTSDNTAKATKYNRTLANTLGS